MKLTRYVSRCAGRFGLGDDDPVCDRRATCATTAATTSSGVTPMADGTQRGFGFRAASHSLLRPGEIVVDLFAGGGGASEALRQALGRDPDICINHDEWAIGMHAANHPFARHLCEDVWEADPRRECAGRRVGWLHASPDCTHFSQAKGGQPRSRKTRALSWVVLKWVGQLAKVGLAPRIISLENVWQILQWGPLVAKRCKATGRALRLDGTAAAPGERLPIEQQFLIPDKRHAGRTWRAFVGALRGMGYVVEWRKLKACDYGAGTSRERLFLIARCDGEPIVWPEPTHGPGRAQPYVTAADCIDWTIPCPSIFERRKPLADATLRRIARGIQRYVIDAATPYFITEFANASNGRTWSAAEPLRTQCAGVKGGHFAVVVPHLTAMAQNVTGNDLRDPLPTVLAGATRFGVVSAFLEQANGGFAAEGPGHDLRQPMSTITASGSQQRLVTCTLSPEQEAGALRVAAFLTTYYGNGDAVSLRDPLDTITTRDRLALVTVSIRGTPYVIVDIGLRMLKPHELYRAQGFPPDYIIDRTADGRRITGTRAVKMVGNSVSPPPLAAIARANLECTHDAREAA